MAAASAASWPKLKRTNSICSDAVSIEPLACALPIVRSLVGLKHESKSAPYAKDRTGRWESKGILSLGTVAAASPERRPRGQLPGLETALEHDREPVTLRRLRPNRLPRSAPAAEGRRTGTTHSPRPRGGVFWGAVTRTLGNPAPPPPAANAARRRNTLPFDGRPHPLRIHPNRRGRRPLYFFHSRGRFRAASVGESAGVRPQMDSRRARRGQTNQAADTPADAKSQSAHSPCRFDRRRLLTVPIDRP